MTSAYDVIAMIESNLPWSMKAAVTNEFDRTMQSGTDENVHETLTKVTNAFKAKIAKIETTKGHLDRILIWQEAHLGAVIEGINYFVNINNNDPCALF